VVEMANMKYNRKRFSRDCNADILGMPLYLFIIIIVTVVGLGILMAWLALIDDPPSNIEIKTTDPEFIFIYDDGAHDDGDAGDGKYANDNFDVTVVVRDNNDKKLSGVVVTLRGMSIEDSNGDNPLVKSNTDGEAVFTGLRILGAYNEGKVTVTAEKGDMSDTSVILVKTK